MANQLDHAPPRQCRLGYFCGRVDRPYGKGEIAREISEHGNVLGDSPWIVTRGFAPTQADWKPGLAK